MILFTYSQGFSVSSPDLIGCSGQHLYDNKISSKLSSCHKNTKTLKKSEIIFSNNQSEMQFDA